MAFHGELLRPITPRYCIECLEKNILAPVVTIHSWYEQYKLEVVVNGFENTCITKSFSVLDFSRHFGPTVSQPVSEPIKELLGYRAHTCVALSLYTLRKLIKFLIVCVVKALAP